MDIDPVAPGPVVNPPSIKNPGTIVITPDPEPAVVAPLTKNVALEVRNYTNIFEDEIDYDQGGYKGILPKDAGGSKKTVIDTQDKTLSKDVSVIVKRSTVAEFDSIPLINETDAEGYTGTLNPVGDIKASYNLDETSSGVLTKPSGAVKVTAETTSTDATYIKSLFPTEYLYEEIDSETGTSSGYVGNLLKTGAYTSTIIGTEPSQGSKQATINESFLKEVDVTASAETKYLDVKAPERGTSTTISYPFPTIHKYNDGAKEGSLKLVSKYYIHVDTSYETKNVSVSPIYDTSPASTYAYNTDGYTGTLNATGVATVSSGQFIAADTKAVTAQTAANYNVSGYSGTLTQYVYSGELLTADTKTVTETNSSFVNNTFYCSEGGNWSISGQTEELVPATIAYNKDNYKGTLSKKGGGVLIRNNGSPEDLGISCSGARLKTYYHQNKEYEQTYSGSATRAFSDTRVYRYKGNVTRPESDTRKWTRTYAGSVSKPTKIFEYYAEYAGTVFTIPPVDSNGAPATFNYTDAQGYIGTMTKKAGTQTRTYENSRVVENSSGVIQKYYVTHRYAADYSGTLYRNVPINKYRYEQTYSGTLAKGSYNFTEGYEREYAGTLFKTVQEELYEYTQTYSGTVTEVK